jgi:GNAT superfamily N-acetyltransferase
MVDVSIRPAVPGDAAAIHALIRELAEYERLTQLCTGSTADLADALFGPRPAAEVLLAEVDGGIAGFALFFHNFSTFLARRGLWLEDLYVQPAFRGHGVGSSLLRAVAAIAVDRRCGRFEWSVLDWNAPAIAFYRSLGADLQPDWRLCRLADSGLAKLARQGE